LGRFAGSSFSRIRLQEIVNEGSAAAMVVVVYDFTFEKWICCGFFIFGFSIYGRPGGRHKFDREQPSRTCPGNPYLRHARCNGIFYLKPKSGVQMLRSLPICLLSIRVEISILQTARQERGSSRSIYRHVSNFSPLHVSLSSFFIIDELLLLLLAYFLIQLHWSTISLPST
jgi:hypothetical protein